MNLKKEIKQAYRQIQVSEDVSEHLKQAVYQKKFLEEETELFLEKPPHKNIFKKYFGFLSAVAVLCISIGISAWNISTYEKEEVFQPAATVPVEITVTETTEPTTEITP